MSQMANNVSGPHKRRTYLPSDGLESAIPAIEQPQTYALDRTVTGMGSVDVIILFSGSRFRASAMTAMNKKPTRCTIVLKSLKLYCILIPLYMFRSLLRPSSGAS
jgi:hypothetical protein